MAYASPATTFMRRLISPSSVFCSDGSNMLSTLLSLTSSICTSPNSVTVIMTSPYAGAREPSPQPLRWWLWTQNSV
eukprot:1039962-Prymnesium_polylepis.3